MTFSGSVTGLAGLKPQRFAHIKGMLLETVQDRDNFEPFSGNLALRLTINFAWREISQKKNLTTELILR